MKPALNREHVGEFAFRDLDDRARDGAMRLLRDAEGHQHSGRWRADCSKIGGGEWVYSSGARIPREIVAYCSRASAPRKNASNAPALQQESA